MNDMCKETKICKTCNIEKFLDEFVKDNTYTDGCRNECKSCRKEYLKQYRIKNKEVLVAKQREHYENNKEELNKISREYYKNNKEVLNKKNKEYAVINKEAISENKKQYYQKPGVKEHVNATSRERYKKNRYKSAWKRLLSSTRKRMNTKKEGRTINELGYSALELKEHIQSLFTEGMTWDNHGEWHIDHIYPVSKFSKDTHPSVVNNLLNLQPMWAKDNISKSDKII